MTSVLIMEDNVALALEWLAVFELNGFDVALEHDGESAIKRLENEKFDLVVTDLIVPEKRGGLSVIGKVLRMRPAPASIVISGARMGTSMSAEDNYLLIQAKRLGATVVLQKPVHAAEIIAVAKDLIAQSD